MQNIDYNKIKQYTCVVKDVEGGRFVDVSCHFFTENPSDMFKVFTFDMNNKADVMKFNQLIGELHLGVKYGKY